MDQTESENQIICWHEQECSDDTDLDRNVYLSAHRIYQIPIETNQEHAADIADTTSQFI